MVVNKAFTYAILALSTIAPWNATAVNYNGTQSFFLDTAQRSALRDDALRLLKVNVGDYSNGGLNVGTQLDTSFDSKFTETMMVKSLLEISNGENEEALKTINALLQVVPNFKLAHLVRGDLLTAQARYLQSFGNVENNRALLAVRDLQDEAKTRIERFLAQPTEEKIPDLLIAPNQQQKHIIVVDTDKSRLYVYQNENGKLKYLNDFYVTVGKNGLEKQSEGDKRTPLGVYFTSAKLTQPLSDLYGDGAYPLNYPNEWDKLHQRKGSGIWLHGTPRDTYSRPPRASDGCIVLTNQDLKSLGSILSSGRTPVIIAKSINWLNDQENTKAYASEQEKQALDASIAQWLSDWRKQDTPQYLSHYSRDFSSNGLNYQQWAEHKARVQAAKPDIKIDISNMSMFTYPGSSKKLVVVDFTQSFKSAHLNNQMQKRQYWLYEDHTWKIVYEDAA
jgi:murein L,D-transpeptidase YafK